VDKKNRCEDTTNTANPNGIGATANAMPEIKNRLENRILVRDRGAFNQLHLTVCWI